MLGIRVIDARKKKIEEAVNVGRAFSDLQIKIICPFSLFFGIVLNPSYRKEELIIFSSSFLVSNEGPILFVGKL